MKIIFIAIALSAQAAMAFANEQKFSVLFRSEGNKKTYYDDVVLKDLVSKKAFDGKYFKIVKGKNKDAIAFTENEELVTKAATVYYHLTEARNYWINHLKSTAPSALEKTVVRLEITNQFDEQGHFANDKRDPQFNNAVSIPAGETPSWVPAEKQDKWGREIWFRPKKVLHVSELPPSDPGPNPITTALKTVEDPFISYSQVRYNQTILEHVIYPNYVARPFYQDTLIFLGTIALTKVVISSSKLLDRFFLEKWYYIDTALVPEVIAHEYAHIILSDSLKMTHSTPVVEGMADYFAAAMSGQRRVYHKIKGVSTNSPKDRRSKAWYKHWHEHNSEATGDFVLSVLWDVREILGEDKGDEVVYEARKYLRTDSATIGDHLLRAILRACESKCESPRADKFELYEAFGKRGF